MVPCLPPGPERSDRRLLLSGEAVPLSTVELGEGRCDDLYYLGGQAYEITPGLRGLLSLIGAAGVPGG